MRLRALLDKSTRETLTSFRELYEHMMGAHDLGAKAESQDDGNDAALNNSGVPRSLKVQGEGQPDEETANIRSRFDLLRM